MKATILLNHTENTREVENEEKSRFLRSILEETGVPVQEFWETDEILSVEQRIKLRNIFSIYDIQVIDDLDGRMQIYVGKEVIAEWHKPLYKLKRNLGELDPRKQLYLEMSVEYWSLFEETNDQSENI